LGFFPIRELTQGSPESWATLGWRPQSLWDCSGTNAVAVIAWDGQTAVVRPVRPLRGRAVMGRHPVGWHPRLFISVPAGDARRRQLGAVTGAVPNRSMAECRRCARPRRAAGGRRTPSSGLAPAAVHIRPCWGRTAAVVGWTRHHAFRSSAAMRGMVYPKSRAWVRAGIPEGFNVDSRG